MSWLVPYVPTPLGTVRRMLRIAGAGPDDVVYDLGCGDGRMLLTAVKEFRVKSAVGYEIRRDLCRYDTSKIRRAGLEDKIILVHGDLFDADLHNATVITLYLNIAVNEWLRPKLEREARVNTRIVSHDFKIEGWRATRKDYPDGDMIYLYTIPESMIKERTKR